MARPSIFTEELGVIYSLSDENGVRYIGQSKKMKRRFAQHNSLSNNVYARPVCHWITKLLRGGKHPIFTVIEATADLDAREIYWIKKFREDGARLLNVSDGGKTMGHTQRAKKLKPWGWSPIQRRLIEIRETANMFKSKGDTEKADRFYGYLDILAKKFSIPGVKDCVNIQLWERYGY